MQGWDCLRSIFPWCASLWRGISCLFYWVSGRMWGLLGNFPVSHVMKEPAQNYRFILRDGIWISSMALNMSFQRRSGFSELKEEFIKILIACERVFMWQIFKVGPEQYLDDLDTFLHWTLFKVSLLFNFLKSKLGHDIYSDLMLFACSKFDYIFNSYSSCFTVDCNLISLLNWMKVQLN